MAERESTDCALTPSTKTGEPLVLANTVAAMARIEIGIFILVI